MRWPWKSRSVFFSIDDPLAIVEMRRRHRRAEEWQRYVAARAQRIPVTTMVTDRNIYGYIETEDTHGLFLGKGKS